MATAGTVQRRRLRVVGIVQGVGFRPHVHRLATETGLVGFVGNDGAGVFVEVEGMPGALDRFVERLRAELPPLARIDDIEATALTPAGDPEFRIVASQGGPMGRTLVPADVSVCDDCLAEVLDPSERRYRYPFTNCTNCGPRFTIIRDLPYDRPATTMAEFDMCPSCRTEYEDPSDRRHHAQPIACPDCGPTLTYDGPGGRVDGTDAALAATHEALGAGAVVAIKGLGGFHLVCDATDNHALDRLRRRKGRVDKPFAVMAGDVSTVAKFARVSDLEAAALTSPARPIVLLRRSTADTLSPLVAPHNPLVGVLLPYTPLHRLLFEPVPGSSTPLLPTLVMTSGNRSEEPISYDDAEARDRLADLADAFLTHDRVIHVPCDDSVVRVVDGEVQPVRRSRGYTPLPVTLPVEVAPTLAVGGELKNTFCLAAGRHAWVSQHIGDMGNLETLEAFEHGVRGFTRLYDIDPVVLATDRHPGYLTRRWAFEHAEARAVVEVQHHHAHVAAAMAEHGFDGMNPVIGFAFDGTGYGSADDGSTEIWGGEVLVADYEGFERVGHLSPMPLPGGDDGVRNPCRIALAYLAATGVVPSLDIPAVAACDDVERRVVARQVDRMAGCVPTTSMGRLFDAVASILGIRHRITYEAQAAIELEAAAGAGVPGAWPLDFGLDASGRIDPTDVLHGLVAGLRHGAAVPDLARAFHDAVVRALSRTAVRVRAATGIDTAALTGGVFQNELLTSATRRQLEADRFTVLTHRLVPPNDGGLALGQAVIAGIRSTQEGA